MNIYAIVLLAGTTTHKNNLSVLQSNESIISIGIPLVLIVCLIKCKMIEYRP